MLLVQSMVIWACEGMIFVSAAQAIGLVVAEGRAVAGGVGGESFVFDSELAGSDWDV